VGLIYLPSLLLSDLAVCLGVACFSVSATVNCSQIINGGNGDAIAANTNYPELKFCLSHGHRMFLHQILQFGELLFLMRLALQILCQLFLFGNLKRVEMLMVMELLIMEKFMVILIVTELLVDQRLLFQ
jgi:hypothetical protein